MPFAITLPDGYGYSAFMALGVIPLLSTIQGGIVTELRKPCGLQYPNHYATAQQAKESPAAHRFNCAQRVDGNYHENMAQTMAYILFAGLEYPRFAAAMGAVWTLFRVIYAYGYINSGKPNGTGRRWGIPFWVPQGILWGLCVKAAISMF